MARYLGRYETKRFVGPALPADQAMDIGVVADGSSWMALLFYGANRLARDPLSVATYALADGRS